MPLSSYLLKVNTTQTLLATFTYVLNSHCLFNCFLQPTQRVTRYPLLLARLAAATPLDHPDHVTAARASEAATRLTLAINEGVRKFENSQRLARIQTRLLEDHHLSMSPGDLSEPLLLDSLDHFRETRALRHCGIVVKRASGRQLLAVLFSDLLLLAVPANGQFEMSHVQVMMDVQLIFLFF